METSNPAATPTPTPAQAATPASSPAPAPDLAALAGRLDALEAENRVLFRYAENPNGSQRDIAGIVNEKRNVMGMMPHPERAADALLGSIEGRVILESMVASLVSKAGK
mgnify:CR=1 FL=1